MFGPTLTPADFASMMPLLFLDTYPGAVEGWALRKIRAEYDGPCVDVIRFSDGAPLTVGFGEDDIVDIAALLAFAPAFDDLQIAK